MYLLMAIILIASVVLDFYEEDWLENMWPERETAVSTSFALVGLSLDGLPQSQWAGKIEDIRKSVPSLQPLASIATLASKKELRSPYVHSLYAGRTVWWNGEDNAWYYAQRIASSQFAIEVKLKDPIPRVLLLWGNMVVILLVTVGIAMWFWVRPLWRDLKRLDIAVAALSAGEFDTRVELNKSAVMYPLAQSFNWMAERIGTLLASHRALTNAVSHELRTPLARLRFAHSLAIDEKDMAGKDRHLSHMRRDMDEIDALATELLTLAKLERAMHGSAAADVFPAKEWLHDRLVEARETAQALGYPVVIEGEARVETLHGSPYYLARALDNLLTNAMRHAASRVDVSVNVENDVGTIIVDDDGDGVPDIDRSRVFEPFVRLDESRDRSSGGAGLGLSIVRQIARTHGGDCVIEAAPSGGARAILTWVQRPHS
jgi:signal transduction histidine kinase